jgi:cytidylate kinase
MSNKPIDISGIRNITVSGRIGSGATTPATHLSEVLGWEILDGGKLFRKINTELGLSITESNQRPDHFDLEYEERIKKMLREGYHQVIQSHLAGFDAQGIDGVFKIAVVVEDHQGIDKPEIRIDRLVNRDNVPIDEAKHEVLERERQHLEKFRRLYAKGDTNWVYWDKKYYDLVVNTFSHNATESVKIVLDALHVPQDSVT